MTAQNQRSRLTITLIQEALISLLEENNFDKISVSDICAESEINRTTFYRYFENQYQLLESMEKELIKELEAHQIDDYYFDLSPEKEEVALAKIADLFRCLEKKIRIYRVLITRTHPNILQKSRHFRKPGMKNALHNRFDEETADYLVRFTIAGGQAMMAMWIKKDRRESPEEMATLMLSMVRGALSLVEDQASFYISTCG